MSRRMVAALLVLPAVLVVIGCGGEDDDPAQSNAGTRSVADCRMGERPDYYVPASRPVVLVGCAQLGVSGKPVEFSVEEPKSGRPGVLVNPTYGDTENYPKSYIFIPGTAFVPTGGLRLVTAEIPKQGVRGYELVRWGETGADEYVAARAAAGEFEAATFEVPQRLANERLRRLFVVELPAAAACGEIAIEDGPGAEETIPVDPRLCARTKQTLSSTPVDGSME